MRDENRRPICGSVLYNLGRLTSYTLIGGVLGLVGEKASITLQVRGVIGLLAGVLMLVMGVCTLGGISMPSLRLPKFMQKGLAALRRHGSFSIGLANGSSTPPVPASPTTSRSKASCRHPAMWESTSSQWRWSIPPWAAVCVSVKSACSVEGTPSKAVYAVSRDRKNALSSWRISLSHLTTNDEITEFLQIFDRCYKELLP